MPSHCLTAEERFKADHPRRLRQALLITLLLYATAFVLLPKPAFRPYQLTENAAIQALEAAVDYAIPPPPPEAPKPVVPTEIAPSDDAGAGATIAATVPEPGAPFEVPVVTRRSPYFDAYDEPPVIVRQVNPVYPELARQAELEGTVVLKVGVNEFGRVREAIVLTSVPCLDEAALDAVRQWEFRPAKQRDVPVPVWFVVPIRFSLRG